MTRETRRNVGANNESPMKLNKLKDKPMLCSAVRRRPYSSITRRWAALPFVLLSRNGGGNLLICPSPPGQLLATVRDCRHWPGQEQPTLFSRGQLSKCPRKEYKCPQPLAWLFPAPGEFLLWVHLASAPKGLREWKTSPHSLCQAGYSILGVGCF